MKRNKIVIYSLFTLCLLLLLAACNNKGIEKEEDQKVISNIAEENNKTNDAVEKRKEKNITLSEWKGIWNNYQVYLEDSELEESMKKLAKNMGMSLEELKKNQIESMKIDFNSMEVKDGKIIFYDDFKENGGKVIEETSYRYKGAHQGKRGVLEFKWYEFEADGESKYPIILLMEIRGENSLIHFNMRYGEDVKEMLSNENWYPTLVKNSTTLGKVKEIIETTAIQRNGHDHDHDHDHEHDHEHDHDHDHDHEHNHEHNHDNEHNHDHDNDNSELKHNHEHKNDNDGHK